MNEVKNAASFRSTQFAVMTISLLVCVGIVWLVWSFVQRARQVRTFADLQSMVWQIEHHNGTRPLEELVLTVAEGRDGWGNPITVVESEDGYLLISRGSDGKLDVGDTSEYFDAEISDVRGKFASDVIFRNGEPLTLAGK